MQLHHAGFDGISQFPVAVETVYPIGPKQIHIIRETLEVVGQDLAYRPEVIKANNSPVPTNLFLEPAHSTISAILAFHKKPDHLVFPGGRDLIHPPILATMPLLVTRRLAGIDEPVPRGCEEALRLWALV